MSRQTGLSTMRRLAPWLLFFAWLAISAAQLWVREIDAVRLGVLGCFSPARTETASLARFLSDQLPSRQGNGARPAAVAPVANELVPRADDEGAIRDNTPSAEQNPNSSPHS